MLELLHIAKRYGAVVALQDASLHLEEGHLHALLGANGSGKSTIIKILAGVVRADQGEIRLDGSPVSLRGPRYAKRLGIAVAFQDLSLIPTLNARENIALALEGIGSGSPLERARAVIETYARELELEFDLDASVSALPIPVRYQLELIKALAQRPRLLILDEVTAALDSAVVEREFRLIRRLNEEERLTVLFVSHRMDEVMQFCSSATIIRDGRTVKTVDLQETSRDEVVRLLVGEEAALEMASAGERVRVDGSLPVVAQVEGLCVPPKVADVSLAVRRGEIVGIGGLQGQGQREFLRALAYLDPPARGVVRLGGEERALSGAREARRRIWFVSGDRGTEGVFAGRTILENLFAQEFAMRGFWSRISDSALLRRSQEILGEVGVSAGPLVPIQTLSGGNQQKVLIGRLLASRPELIVLDDPMIGVDVHARHEIHELIRKMAESGCGVLMYSSDDEELISLCDRVLVFFEGRVVRELHAHEMNREALMHATLGQEAGVAHA